MRRLPLPLPAHWATVGCARASRDHAASDRGSCHAASSAAVATDRKPLTWHFRGTTSDRRLGKFEAPRHHIGLPGCVLGVERPPDVPTSPPICKRSTRVRRDSSLNVMYLLDCDNCWILNLAPNEDAFDGLSASTNACSATSHHICHVSATCRKYGVKRTLVAPPLQPFSQKSRTPTVAKEFQIDLCGVVEADLALFYNCWSAGFLGERL